MAGQSFLDMYMNKKLGKVVTVTDVYEINSKIPWMFFRKKLCIKLDVQFMLLHTLFFLFCYFLTFTVKM